MFFLSASANILFYSLISVFFFLCFSFHPKLEITEIAPVGMTEGYQISLEAEQTFCCSVCTEFQQEDTSENTFSFRVAGSLTFPYTVPWNDYFLVTGFSLRAPPALSLNLV